MLLSLGLHHVMAQSRLVRGRVLDDKGEGVPGASIHVKGSTAGTITDADGNFTLDVPNENSFLLIQSVGFGDKEIEARDGAQALAIRISSSSHSLDEAVVVGYGSETRKTLIGGSSVIKEKAFKDVPMGNFTNMLQGKAPGVMITGQNGAPGAPAFIRIRGVGSINAGQGPLIVIDGVPSTSEAYTALSPNDIADVTVLKDASTNSIYGSRGSNGVIVVTTRKGGRKGSPPQITYGFQYGFKSKTPDKFKMMSFSEKLQYERDLGYTNKYLKPLLAKDSLSSITEAPDPNVYWNQLRPYETDWQKEILRTGRLSQHDIAINGATDKFDYYFSLQSYNEDGISLASNFVRRAGMLNVDYRANDWLKIGQSIRVTNSSSKDTRETNNVQNPFRAIYQYNPYEAVYDFGTSSVNGYNRTQQPLNIVEALRTNPAFSNTLYGASTTYLELTPVKDITLRSQLGLQYVTSNGESITRPGSMLDMVLNGTPTGSKTDDGYYRFNYVWTNTVQYKKTFAAMHNLKLLAGTEFTKEQFKSYSLSSKGYPYNTGLTTQNNGSSPEATTTARESWTLFSLFGRAEYSYAGKYLANFSVRRDGSSRFGKDNRYGTFIAGGLAWNLTEETFLKSVSSITSMKLWASLGTSGNNQIGNYDALALYKSGGYGGQTSFYPGNIGNTGLTWEKNTNYSFGLDFGFFQNRISGTIDYYNRYTYALLLDRPISPTTGYTAQMDNVGSMRNSGMELSLNLDVLRKRDFLWSIGGNITLNKNRIVKLADGEAIRNTGTANTYYVVGKPIDVYYLQQYAGVDPVNGDELWYKKDGTTTNNYNEADLFYLDKTPDPSFFGGFYTNLSYKGIQLGIDCAYAGGNYIYNQMWANANTPKNVTTSNMAMAALDYWRPDNTGASNPRADYNQPAYNSDRWLQKGNFIRLRNVTLSYNLPVSLISRVKMQALRVYVQGQNLWYSAPGFKGDPEVGTGAQEGGFLRSGAIALYSYPQSKVITFGLNVTF